MAKPILAVIGRPNVGKSTFFNKMSGHRISIVEDFPGVTRDRVYADTEWLGRNFTIIDTGGLEPDSDDIILSQMKRQAQIAIDIADVILFMVDGKQGLTNTDEDIAQILRISKKPVVLVVNKIDTQKLPDNYYDFFTLGLGEPIAISSINALNFGDLLDMVIESFPPGSDFTDVDESTKIAIIGKPNVGKSSIINKIFNEERVIVSPIAGTTREAIDTKININGKDYTFIDTAGIRKKNKIYDNIEKYAVVRSLAAIDRADICMLIIDANEGITEQDKRIAGYAHEAGKGIIIVVNKWDLLEKDNSTHTEYVKTIKDELTFMSYAPSIFISAKTGQRVNKLVELIDYVHQNQTFRISTGVLNDVLNEAITMNQPPSDKGKRLRVYYGTQVDVTPPKIVLFVNYSELAHFSYIRYLENKIRENFNFEGTPIVIELSEKKK
jgi:GTP-binding protein